MSDCVGEIKIHNHLQFLGGVQLFKIDDKNCRIIIDYSRSIVLGGCIISSPDCQEHWLNILGYLGNIDNEFIVVNHKEQ